MAIDVNDKFVCFFCLQFQFTIYVRSIFANIECMWILFFVSCLQLRGHLRSSAVAFDGACLQTSIYAFQMYDCIDHTNRILIVHLSLSLSRLTQFKYVNRDVSSVMSHEHVSCCGALSVISSVHKKNTLYLHLYIGNYSHRCLFLSSKLCVCTTCCSSEF